MAACEKCWADAFWRMTINPFKSQTEHYQDLLEERKDNPCSEKEQKGKDAQNGTIRPRTKSD